MYIYTYIRTYIHIHTYIHTYIPNSFLETKPSLSASNASKPLLCSSSASLPSPFFACVFPPPPVLALPLLVFPPLLCSEPPELAALDPYASPPRSGTPPLPCGLLPPIYMCMFIYMYMYTYILYHTGLAPPARPACCYLQCPHRGSC